MTYVPPRAELMYCSCLHAKACLAQHLHCKPMYANAWDELQRIKNETVGEEVWCVECYPAQSKVVNVSNMRHL